MAQYDINNVTDGEMSSWHFTTVKGESFGNSDKTYECKSNIYRLLPPPWFECCCCVLPFSAWVLHKTFAKNTPVHPHS